METTDGLRWTQIRKLCDGRRVHPLGERLSRLKSVSICVHLWFPFLTSTVSAGFRMNPTRILLADDHTLVRAGVRALLEELPDVTVVAEAADGHQALAFTKAHQPHVVFMDVAMSGLNGLETTARMAKEFPDVRVIILSM